MDAQSFVPGKKLIDAWAFMPGSIVCPKINYKAPKSGHNLREHFKKTICISSHPFHHAMVAVEGIDPAKKIEALMMLAASIDEGLCSLLPPYSSELRLEGKAGFIFRLPLLLRVRRSFLLSRGIRLLHCRWPEHIGTSVGAKCIQAFSSSSGHVAPAPSFDGIFSDTRQPQRRPASFWIGRNTEATWTMLHQVLSLPFRQAGSACRDVDDPQWLQSPPYWPSEPALQRPIGSIQRGRQSEWIASPPTSAGKRRFGFRPMPRVSPPPCAEEPLELALDAFLIIAPPHRSG